MQSFNTCETQEKVVNRKINKELNYIILVFASICLAGCAPAPVREPSPAPVGESRKEVPLRLDSISLNKKSFEPSTGETVDIRFEPSKACLATMTICDSWGLPVRVLADNKPVSSSLETVTWDGLDEGNTEVADGVYFYVVELRDGDESYVYNPYRKTHGIKLRSVTGFYDQEKNEINYTVPQAAMVRIRVGLKDGGPLLITLLDWTPKTAGTYSVKWDGKDASGHFELGSHPERNAVIFAYTLADNSIIVGSGEKTSTSERVSAKPLFSPALPMDRDMHARNYLKMAREPHISAEFLGDVKKTEMGIPVVKGIVPVRVSIAPEDKLALEDSRYEIMFYVDTVFLFEEESGFSPFTYMWDTRGLSEGEHLLTVNLWSYEDNCGVITKKVVVKEDKK